LVATRDAFPPVYGRDGCADLCKKINAQEGVVVLGEKRGRRGGQYAFTLSRARKRNGTGRATTRKSGVGEKNSRGGRGELESEPKLSPLNAPQGKKGREFASRHGTRK